MRRPESSQSLIFQFTAYSCNKHLWSTYFGSGLVQGPYDTIRQSTPCPVARRDIQINNSITYCGPLNRCVAQGAMGGWGRGGTSILLGSPKRVSKNDCSCNLKEYGLQSRSLVWGYRVLKNEYDVIKGRMQERHSNPRETTCKHTVA